MYIGAADVDPLVEVGAAPDRRLPGEAGAAELLGDRAAHRPARASRCTPTGCCRGSRWRATSAAIWLASFFWAATSRAIAACEGALVLRHPGVGGALDRELPRRSPPGAPPGAPWPPCSSASRASSWRFWASVSSRSSSPGRRGCRRGAPRSASSVRASASIGSPAPGPGPPRSRYEPTSSRRSVNVPAERIVWTQRGPVGPVRLAQAGREQRLALAQLLGLLGLLLPRSRRPGGPAAPPGRPGRRRPRAPRRSGRRGRRDPRLRLGEVRVDAGEGGLGRRDLLGQAALERPQLRHLLALLLDPGRERLLAGHRRRRARRRGPMGGPAIPTSRGSTSDRDQQARGDAPGAAREGKARAARRPPRGAGCGVAAHQAGVVIVRAVLRWARGRAMAVSFPPVRRRPKGHASGRPGWPAFYSSLARRPPGRPGQSATRTAQYAPTMRNGPKGT